MVAPNIWVMINLYKKCLSVITWNKKHLLKQVLSMIYNTLLEKYFFGSATFKGMCEISFQ